MKQSEGFPFPTCGRSCVTNAEESFYQQRTPPSQLQHAQNLYIPFKFKIALVVVMISVDQWKAFQVMRCASDTGSLLLRRIV